MIHHHAKLLGKFALPSSFVRQLDLLPCEFYEEVETNRVRGWWAFVLTLLLIGFGNLVLTDWLRAESSRRYAKLLKDKVAPVLEIRNQALQQSVMNQKLQRWIGHVESARPDDSLVQTLAAVTTAVRTQSREAMVDSIEIALPTEIVAISSAADDSPNAHPHTVGKLAIDLRVSQTEIVQQLLARLAEQPRLDDVSVQGDTVAGDGTRLKIYAVPQATRVQP